MGSMLVLQCLLHMPQFEFAVRTAESTAVVQNLGEAWGMCSKHCNTKSVHARRAKQLEVESYFSLQDYFNDPL